MTELLNVLTLLLSLCAEDPARYNQCVAEGVEMIVKKLEKQNAPDRLPQDDKKHDSMYARLGGSGDGKDYQMGLNFKRIAEEIAAASKDLRYQIGAVIFDDDDIIVSTGYNGAPRGVLDKPARYMKPDKQYYIAHAEENAIAQAARKGAATYNCTMLIWGKMPCANCARMIIQAGIKAVIFQAEDITLSNYRDSFSAASTMFAEAGVKITFIEE